MNYLQLCQKVVRKGAIAGGDNVPVSVQDQTGRMRLVVDWVNDANAEIQAYRNDFSFRVREIDYGLSAGQSVLRMTDTHDDVEAINDMSVSVRDANNNRQISAIPWHSFRNIEQQPSAGLPNFFSVDTVGDIHFLPPPAGNCVFSGECRLKPQIMTEDTDEPLIPEGYQDVIVYRALMFFYEYDESITYETAERQYREWLMRLMSVACPLSDWHYTQSTETLLVMNCD